MRRGQALVEAALVTPILLLVILGGLMLGLMLLDRIELSHAAQEGAVAGAMNHADSCGVALSSAHAVYGRRIDEETCEVQGQMIEVHLVHRLPLIIPLFADVVSINVTERAVLR